MGLRSAPDLIITVLTCCAGWLLLRRIATLTGPRRSAARFAVMAGIAAALWGVLLEFAKVAHLMPSHVYVAMRGASILAFGALVYTAFVLELFGRAERFVPERRQILSHAMKVAFAAPVAVAAAAFIERNNLLFREVDIRIPNLPKDLEGLRIVQVSDLHLSPLVSEKLVARAIDLANSTSPHIAIVTGDLITIAADPLDTCLRHVSRLRSDAGILGCLGNHEEYALATDYTTEAGARLGIRFLRHDATTLRFGTAKLRMAGVDYQSRYKPYLVGAEDLVDPDAYNVLLSHNPDVFPVAARKGFDLTLSGHTHGGQVNVEILRQDLNVVRFITPYVYGLYESSGKSIYVTRGVGTIGVPARLGAPPEVALIRLCGISS